MTSQNSFSRRDFLRYACAGAGALTWTGCASTGPRRPAAATQPPFDPNADFHPLLSEENFRRIVDAAMSASKAEILSIRLTHEIHAATTFNVERIDGDETSTRSALTILIGGPDQPLRSLTIDKLTPEAVAQAVNSAETNGTIQTEVEAQATSTALPPQRYLVLPTYRLATADADADRRADDAERARSELTSMGLPFTGTIETVRLVAGAANRQGLLAYEPRTRAAMRLECGTSPLTLPLAALHRSLDDLEIVETIRRWAPALRVLQQERSLAPGRRPLILSPEATAQLAYMLLEHETHEAWSVSPDFSFRNHPAHPALLARGFDDDGRATNALPLVEKGRRVPPSPAASTADASQNPPPATLADALFIAGDAPSAANLADLIQSVERGVFVPLIEVSDGDAAQAPIRSIRPRPGAFLIENGRLTGVARSSLNIDPIAAFANPRAYTMPLPAAILRDVNGASPASPTIRKAFAPALVIEDFQID